MTQVLIATSPTLPELQEAEQVPDYLGWFFSSGRARQDLAVEVSGDLWDILGWAWSLAPNRRQASPLCRLLLLDGEHGWREEGDVIDAMAWQQRDGNPARQDPRAVADLAAAVMSESEAMRQRSRELRLALDFLLPRIADHPVLDTDAICEALRRQGVAEERIRYHREAVHPELQAYRGTWELLLQDRGPDTPTLQVDPAAAAVVPIARPACGRRSRVALRLLCEDELAAYFRLSAGGWRPGP